MLSILVVEDDPHLRSALEQELLSNGYATVSAPEVQEALRVLAEQQIDVLITDLRLGERDGIDLLQEVQAQFPETRTILMSGYATARDHQTAIENGAVRVLCKPFAREQLLEAVQQAADCSSGFQGSVHGLSLPDMLQMFNIGRRSLTIELSGQASGEIHIRDGEVVDAVCGDQRGIHGLRALIGAHSGSVRTSPVRHCAHTIDMPFNNLLLEVHRLLDEEGLAGPPSVLEEFDLDGDLFDLDALLTETSGAGDAQRQAESERESESSSNASGGAFPPPPEPQDNQPKEESMGRIDDACKQVVTNVDGAVACGVVDLDTGFLLGIHNTSQYTTTHNEMVAAAAMNLFRGPNVSQVEELVRRHRGVPENGEHYFQEIQVTSARLLHFMKTLREGRAVIVLVTSKSTSVGMGWAQLKSVIPDVEAHIP